MKPVDQLILADPARGDGHNTEGVPGDCWRACIASLLELPVDDVPHFVHEFPDGADWWYETCAFVSHQLPGADLKLWNTNITAVSAPETSQYVIASGPSPRGDFHHAVIYDARTGTLAHDPHPSRAGINEVTAIFYLHTEGTAR